MLGILASALVVSAHRHREVFLSSRHSHPEGFFQLDGIAGWGGIVRGIRENLVAVDAAVLGRDVLTLGAVDGGTGHIENEKAPLLAMLAPPTESWLERRGIVGGGD